MTEKQCQFCGKTGPHPKAHIWPKALYGFQNGRPLSLAQLDGSGRLTRTPTGIYDANLWCDKCEANAATLDEKVVPFLKSPESHLVECDNGFPRRPAGGPLVLRFNDLNATDLIIFILSVLWRASASERKEVASFTLGPLQNKVRDIITLGEVENSSRFKLIVRFEKNRNLRRTVVLPKRTKLDGIGAIHFIASGFEFWVKTDKRNWAHHFDIHSVIPGNPVQVALFSLVETATGAQLRTGLLRRR